MLVHLPNVGVCPLRFKGKCTESPGSCYFSRAHVQCTATGDSWLHACPPLTWKELMTSHGGAAKQGPRAIEFHRKPWTADCSGTRTFTGRMCSTFTSHRGALRYEQDPSARDPFTQCNCNCKSTCKVQRGEVAAGGQNYTSRKPLPLPLPLPLS